MKKIICVTGMDGTGKSTLIQALSNRISNVYVAKIWDLLESPIASLPFKSKSEVDDFLCNLTPDSRLLFLAHAMKYSIDKALASEKENILIDSYYFKYFASELALGANEALVKSLIDSFPKPDIIIELYLSLKESAERKAKFSKYECGITSEATLENFIHFQEKTQTFWTFFDNTHWHKINARLQANDVLNQSLLLLK